MYAQFEGSTPSAATPLGMHAPHHHHNQQRVVVSKVEAHDFVGSQPPPWTQASAPDFMDDEGMYLAKEAGGEGSELHGGNMMPAVTPQDTKYRGGSGVMSH